MTRTALRLVASAAAVLVAAPVSQAAAAPPLDLLITGGDVYAGDLSGPRRLDIGIRGDRIVFVGDAGKAGVKAGKTLDASGKMVMPGFIDAHVHADEIASDKPEDRLVLRQLLQGVTTSVVGVDGEGPPDVRATFERLNRIGVGQNIATYVGFGAVRRAVLGDEARAPDPAELARERALVAKGMCEGALGLSSGLFYAPQSFAKTDEVIAAATEAGKRGGIYDTHQRDEGDSSVGLLTSLKEAIRIGAESGAPLHLAHIKVSGGSDTMSEMIALIEAARAAGQPVTADQYPWIAANTGLVAAVIPRWAQAGGRAEMLKRFDNPADVARIRAEASTVHADANNITINGAPNQPELVGKRLGDIAAAWGIDPAEATMRILRKDNASVSVFVMTEPDIKRAMTQPWVISSSDGRSGGHPRAYASYPRLWENYVVADKVLTPQQFVHRSTGAAAEVLGIPERGYLRAGYFADVVVIDPADYHARATFERPRELSTGVVDVVVNGKLEIEAGKPTGVMSGRGLVKAPKAGSCS